MLNESFKIKYLKILPQNFLKSIFFFFIKLRTKKKNGLFTTNKNKKMESIPKNKVKVPFLS